jgi:hypothetical protein
MVASLARKFQPHATGLKAVLAGEMMHNLAAILGSVVLAVLLIALRLVLPRCPLILGCIPQGSAA